MAISSSESRQEHEQEPHSGRALFVTVAVVLLVTVAVSLFLEKRDFRVVFVEDAFYRYGGNTHCVVNVLR